MEMQVPGQGAGSKLAALAGIHRTEAGKAAGR